MKHAQPYPAKLFSNPSGGLRAFSWHQLHLFVLFLDTHMICQPVFSLQIYGWLVFLILTTFLKFHSQNRDTKCSQSANFSWLIWSLFFLGNWASVLFLCLFKKLDHFTGKTCVTSLWEGKNIFPLCGPSLQALTYLHWRCHLLDGSVDIFQQKLQQFSLYELVYGFWKTQLFPLCWAPWNSTKSCLVRF